MPLTIPSRLFNQSQAGPGRSLSFRLSFRRPHHEARTSPSPNRGQWLPNSQLRVASGGQTDDSSRSQNQKRGAPIPSLRLFHGHQTEYVRSIFIPRRGEQPTFRTISLSSLVSSPPVCSFACFFASSAERNHITSRVVVVVTSPNSRDCFASLSSLPRHGRRRGRRR